MESLLNEGDFAPLNFGRREFNQTVNMYRVYEAPNMFTEVEADSAYEAMTRSQITKPFKISRYALKNLQVLSCGMLSDGASAAAVETPAEAETAADTAES